MTYRLVAVKAVNVQKIDRSVGKVAVGLVEGPAQELREGGIVLVVKTPQVGKDILVIRA